MWPQNGSILVSGSFTNRYFKSEDFMFGGVSIHLGVLFTHFLVSSQQSWPVWSLFLFLDDKIQASVGLPVFRLLHRERFAVNSVL